MFTEKDRLHSLWQNIKLPNFPQLNSNKSTEVCIVGGGIAGISIAYELNKRGYNIILLEASTIGSGQTGRTTAHLTYQPEESLSTFVKKLGKIKVKKFIQAHQEAITQIEKNIIKENIACDFKEVDGYFFTTKSNSINNELRAIKKLNLGLQDVPEIPNFPQLGRAIKYPAQAQFHPLKYINGLLNSLQLHSSFVFENSPVKDFNILKNKIEVITKNNYIITAKYLVVATDTPINNRFHIHTKQAPYRTYVLGFNIDPDFTVPLMWDDAAPYHYIRKFNSTLIIGGSDHKTGQMPDENPFVTLETWSRNKIPGLGEIKHQWSGQIYEPIDQVAYIGKNPGIGNNVFICTGAAGMGMTTGTIASQLIADLIQKKKNPFEKIFSPSRVSLSGAGTFLKENANVAVQYFDWISQADIKNISDLPPDEGALIQDHLHKDCVYKDKNNSLETKCATCPHLKGIIQWNSLEKTWDCPLHGSRFNTKGNVIEGPAISNLSEP